MNSHVQSTASTSASKPTHTLYWDAKVWVRDRHATFLARFILEGPRMSGDDAQLHVKSCVRDLESGCRKVMDWFTKQPWFTAAECEAKSFHWKATLAEQAKVFKSKMSSVVDLAVEVDPHVWHRRYRAVPEIDYCSMAGFALKNWGPLHASISYTRNLESDSAHDES